MSPLSNSVASEQPDPDAPLRRLELAGETWEIRQRITGALYVRQPDGAECDFPVGFSVDDVEKELRVLFMGPPGGAC